MESASYAMLLLLFLLVLVSCNNTTNNDNVNAPVFHPASRQCEIGQAVSVDYLNSSTEVRCTTYGIEPTSIYLLYIASLYVSSLFPGLTNSEPHILSRSSLQTLRPRRV